MLRRQHAKSRNRFLATLSADDYNLLRPRLEHVSLERGYVLAELNQPFENLYFLESGITTAVAIAPDGRRIEVGIYSCEGRASQRHGFRNTGATTLHMGAILAAQLFAPVTQRD